MKPTYLLLIGSMMLVLASSALAQRPSRGGTVPTPPAPDNASTGTVSPR